MGEMNFNIDFAPKLKRDTRIWWRRKNERAPIMESYIAEVRGRLVRIADRPWPIGYGRTWLVLDEIEILDTEDPRP